MRRSLPWIFVAATLLLSSPLQAQYGGGRLVPAGGYGPNAPKLPGVELAGPLDSALARVLLSLTPQEANRYAQAYDSFMVATRPARDSAAAALAKMNERLDAGDRAAAMFYAERAQEFGKDLKDRQERFENDLRHWLSADQVKAYKKWRDGEDQAAERRRRQDVMRWQEAGLRGDFGPRATGVPEIKTALGAPAGVAPPALGSQAVRVGRMLYVAAQLGVDSSSALAGSDLRTQAARAFANLGAVLQASGATPRDVTTLTIYVVNYRPADIATIRDAGLAYFGANAPIATVLGVQSLSREGALIAIAAQALSSAAPAGRER